MNELHQVSRRPCRLRLVALILTLGTLAGPATAGVLFEDDFNRGIPGWTAGQPEAAYYDGPLRWQYDIVSGAFAENSNLYTDSATHSPSAIAPMLINDTVTGRNFTYSARLVAGDDDGFGLIFGYLNEDNFYRVTFARQARAGGFPWTGWSVDRKVNGVTANLFGAGTPSYVQTFVNTAARPFDVTVSVNNAGELTLGVVDNPTGTPVNYALVSGQPLPGWSGGKVGLFTWGMAGGTPSGFRISSLSLSPAPLSGNPNALTNWTPVVPPRANGSTVLTGGQGVPAWGLAVRETGSYGRLFESGDCYAGNDAAGQVDFTGPTLVAGDPAWSNYVVVARITPRDDDAHGLLLRYANPTNFYRIALRAQSSTLGPPRGLSIQKCVNGAYTEIYRDNPVKYDPVANVPYDLVAAISNRTLEVQVVADPDGAAQAFVHGPFTLSGSTVNAGKVGLLSWGMSQVEFEFIKVQDGTPLYVSAPFGDPNPPRGLAAFAPGALVTAYAGDPIQAGGTRRSPRGWLGSGSVPASGTGTNVTFTLNAFSRINWQWQTEYRLTVTNEPGGTVSFPPGGWFPEGTNVVITAVPDAGSTFAGWRGDVLAAPAVLSLTMTQAFSLTATFTRDADADGLPDEWEQAWFGNLGAAPGGDPDGDGRTNLQEWHNGTDPLGADILRLERLQVAGNLGTLSISNDTGTRYSLLMTTNLASGWITLAWTQLAATVTTALPGPRAYYRLSQPARPPDALPWVPGSWTIAVLPDTQVYAMSYPEFFKDQTRWIAANRDRRNIKYVLHLGDVTNNNVTNQWTAAFNAFQLLDGQVPYAITLGNHDYGPNGGCADRTTFFHDYFPVSKYLFWPTFGGVKEPTRLDNNFHLFSAGGVDWLVLALEFGPRNSTVAWASSIIAQYPTRRVILITHAYMYYDETRYDWATKGSAQSWNPHAYPTASDPDGTNDGEELWHKLVKLHPNVTFVLNGHVLNDGLGRLSSVGDHGNVVHQMLVNYQMQVLGGEAYLRLLEFLPDGRTVQVKAYSPLLGTYKTDPQNQFILTLDPPLH
jgi:hypothetical protein